MNYLLSTAAKKDAGNRFWTSCWFASKIRFEEKKRAVLDASGWTNTVGRQLHWDECDSVLYVPLSVCSCWKKNKAVRHPVSQNFVLQTPSLWSVAENTGLPRMKASGPSLVKTVNWWSVPVTCCWPVWNTVHSSCWEETLPLGNNTVLAQLWHVVLSHWETLCQPSVCEPCSTLLWAMLHRWMVLVWASVTPV